MRPAHALALVLLSCAAARTTTRPVDRAWGHIPQLSASDAPAAEEINRQLTQAFDALASCEPQAVEQAHVDGDITLLAPHLIGVVAHVDVTCLGALHPVLENVSFFFDPVSGARWPTVLELGAEPELARRFREKAPPDECAADDFVANGLLLEPRVDGLLITTNVGWAFRPCAQRVMFTWKELDGLLAHPPQ